MTTYQHGGDIQNFAKKAGCRVEEVIDLSSNINFVKPQAATVFGYDLVHIDRDRLDDSHVRIAIKSLPTMHKFREALYA